MLLPVFIIEADSLKTFVMSFRFIGCVVLLCTAFSSAGWAQGQIVGQDTLQNPVITAVPFLSISPDARSAALGDAGGALSADANGAYWNAAKLSFIDKDFGASLSYTPWLQRIVGDMSLVYMSGFKRLSNLMVVGASMRYFDLGSMEFTDRNRNIIAEFNPREFAFTGTFSMRLSDRFGIGGSARYIYSNLSGNISNASTNNDIRPGQSASVDMGAFYQNKDMMLGNYPATVVLGANISNVGFKMTYSDENQQDFLPTNLRISSGLTTELDSYNKITFALDINKMMVPTPPQRNEAGQIVQGKDPDRSLLSGMFGSFNDAPGGFSEELREFVIAGGIEYWYSDLFAARGGYFHENGRKGARQYFTVGLGLRYQKFGLDFAYLIPRMQNHPLQDTIRFTLLINFDGKSATPGEAPPVSPDTF